MGRGARGLASPPPWTTTSPAPSVTPTAPTGHVAAPPAYSDAGPSTRSNPARPRRRPPPWPPAPGTRRAPGSPPPPPTRTRTSGPTRSGRPRGARPRAPRHPPRVPNSAATSGWADAKSTSANGGEVRARSGSARPPASVARVHHAEGARAGGGDELVEQVGQQVDPVDDGLLGPPTWGGHASAVAAVERVDGGPRAAPVPALGDAGARVEVGPVTGHGRHPQAGAPRPPVRRPVRRRRTPHGRSRPRAGGRRRTGASPGPGGVRRRGGRWGGPRGGWTGCRGAGRPGRWRGRPAGPGGRGGAKRTREAGRDTGGVPGTPVGIWTGGAGCPGGPGRPRPTRGPPAARSTRRPTRARVVASASVADRSGSSRARRRPRRPLTGRRGGRAARAASAGSRGR